MPVAISWEPASIAVADERTLPTMLARATCMSPSDASTLLAGAVALPDTVPRSPDATRRAAALSCTGSAPRDRIRLRLMSAASAVAARMDTTVARMSMRRLLPNFSAAWLIS
ncbi:hypothetical protein D3C71_1388090 [compost metagenome]